MQPNELMEYGKKKNMGIFSISFVISAIITILLLQFVFEIDQVSGLSMYPTLNDGQYVFCIKNNFRHFRVGDIVNIDSVILDTNIVKRIIGVGEDTIEIDENGNVYRNGEKLNESYINDSNGTTTTPISITVPNGYLFVMGDNREVSADSREIGCISESEVVSVILFSFD